MRIQIFCDLRSVNLLVAMAFLKVVVLCVCAVSFGQALRLPEFTVPEGKKEYDELQFKSTSMEKEFVLSNDKLSWSEAELACKNQGMQLATLETPAEKEKLIFYIKSSGNTPVDKFSGYWMGGKIDSNLARFVWKSSGNAIEGVNWLPGEPNPFPGENCVELKLSWHDLGLNNYYCDQQKRYICEYTISFEDQKNKEKFQFQGDHEETFKAPLEETKDSYLEFHMPAEVDEDSNSGPQRTTPQKIEIPNLEYKMSTEKYENLDSGFRMPMEEIEFPKLEYRMPMDENENQYSDYYDYNNN